MLSLLLWFHLILPPAYAAPSFPEVAQQIGLSSQQQALVQEIIYRSDLARVEIRARRDRAELQLRQLLSAETLDENAVHAALAELNAAETDLRNNRVELVIALRKNLSPSQWEALRTLWLEAKPPPPPPHP